MFIIKTEKAEDRIGSLQLHRGRKKSELRLRRSSLRSAFVPFAPTAT